MRAVCIDSITTGEEVKISNVEIPKIKSGWALIKVKAFGLNHSEQILRLSEITAPYIKKPVIPGIECVGTIEDAGDTRFKKGDKVCAVMGGMGRTFDGSYAEYTLIPENHIFKIESNLDWVEMAAVPETYFTAWGSLFECLNLNSNDTLLVRGATCALGYATIQIAKSMGCKVTATTHRESKLALLKKHNVDVAILDDGKLEGKITGVTKALELVGPSVIRDTLKSVDKGAIVCETGILGGVYSLDDFDPIKEIPNGVYLTGFFSNFPTEEIMQNIFEFLDKNNLKPDIGKIYNFEDITQACIDMDNKKINGKIVVKI
jgi:NADPH:quinone reductase-like Zn-dependent oxidoreductase